MSEVWRNRIVAYREVDVDAAVLNERNWRRHPEEQGEALDGVMNDVGIVQNILINLRTSEGWPEGQRNIGTLLDGELRILKARAAGQRTLPATIVDLTPSEEAEVLATLDPLGAMAQPDRDCLGAVIEQVRSSTSAVQALLENLARENALHELAGQRRDAGPQTDRSEELQAKWAVCRGQLWEVPSRSVPGRCHRLLCGDATQAADVGRLFGAEKARMAFTDPPYNVAYEGKAGQGEVPGDARSWQSFTFFVDAWMELLLAHVTGAVYIAMGASEWPTVQLAFVRHGGHLAGVIAWVKQHFVLGRSDYQHQWEPILAGEAGNESAELALYGWPEGARRAWAGGRKECDVWRVPRPVKSPEHPTMKPVALVARAIQNSSERGALVADFFLGSGTTMVAAEETGRVCYGLELTEKFVAAGLERLALMGLKPHLAQEV